MPTAMSEPSSSHLHELDRELCDERLGSHHIGRVAWNAPDGPMVLPVTYAFYNGEVVFRTSPFGPLSPLTKPTNVAFEIDEIDEDAGTGWSVVVRGRAEAVVRAYDLASVWSLDGLVPWAPGTRNLIIAITPRKVTGRAVKAPFAD